MITNRQSTILPFRVRLRQIISAAFGTILVAGCSSPQKNTAEWDLHPSWNPYYLYSSAQPYRALYVEVDAVAGMEPSDETLNALKTFLQEYCDKPDGVTISRSDVIPRKDARGRFSNELALWYVNGPGTNWSGNPPAFLYVLYYDSSIEPPRLARPHDMTTRSAAVFPPTGGLVNQGGHATYLPYPAAIFVNGHWRGGDVDAVILKHEAGHALGLHYGQSLHCDRDDCLMYPSLLVKIRSVFAMRNVVANKKLCSRCHEQFMANQKLRASESLRFEGPWLARREREYEVWSLPSLAVVYAPVVPAAGKEEFWREIKRSVFSSLNFTNRDVTLTICSSNLNGVASLQAATNDWFRDVKEQAQRHLREQTDPVLNKGLPALPR